jgi:hypothetical protein
MNLLTLLSFYWKHLFDPLRHGSIGILCKHCMRYYPEELNG